MKTRRGEKGCRKITYIVKTFTKPTIYNKYFPAVLEYHDHLLQMNEYLLKKTQQMVVDDKSVISKSMKAMMRINPIFLGKHTI